jgi:hypothetical protein
MFNQNSEISFIDCFDFVEPFPEINNFVEPYTKINISTKKKKSYFCEHCQRSLASKQCFDRHNTSKHNPKKMSKKEVEVEVLSQSTEEIKTTMDTVTLARKRNVEEDVIT